MTLSLLVTWLDYTIHTHNVFCCAKTLCNVSTGYHVTSNEGCRRQRLFFFMNTWNSLKVFLQVQSLLCLRFRWKIPTSKETRKRCSFKSRLWLNCCSLEVGWFCDLDSRLHSSLLSLQVVRSREGTLTSFGFNWRIRPHERFVLFLFTVYLPFNCI